MKKLFLILLTTTICSCDNYKPASEQLPEAEIGQYVNLDGGRFTLHTYLCVSWGFRHNMYSNDFVYLYGNTVTGSFDYIKSLKPNEYKKADSVAHTSRIKFFIDSISLIQRNFKNIKDSIAILNKF